MKVNPKAKYLQYFCKQAHNQGFSRVHFLLFLLIICSLAPLAWSIYVEHDTSIQQTQGRTYVGSMNRAQQAYYLENFDFTDCLEYLGLGIQPDTKSYSYRIALGVPIGKNRYRFVLPSSPKKLCSPPKEERKIPSSQPPIVVMNTAIPKNPKLKTYVGLVVEPDFFYGTNRSTTILVCEATTTVVFWESKKPSTPPPEIWLRPPKITGYCGGRLDPFISPPEGFQEVSPKVKQNSDFWDLRLPWF